MLSGRWSEALNEVHLTDTMKLGLSNMARAQNELDSTHQRAGLTSG